MTYKIIVASQKEKLADTLLYRSLVAACINPDNVLFYGNNSQSITSIYNKGIEECKKQDIKIAVFIHDDVYINCDDFESRIRKYANKFTLTGLAGTKSITIKEPVLWHLMGERDSLRGCVGHGNDENFYSYTSFGPVPDKVIMIDGVFMVVNLTKLPEKNNFDEKIPSKFHFYDLCFSLDCSLNRVPVGVGDVPIIHNSPGLREMSEDWLSGQKYFLNKYNKFVGKKLTV